MVTRPSHVVYCFPLLLTVFLRMLPLPEAARRCTIDLLMYGVLLNFFESLVGSTSSGVPPTEAS